jgi:hypothetical protein
MMRTLRRTRRAVRRAAVATAVLAVMALTTAVVATSGPTPVETATAQGASSLVCIELSSPDYVDTTCLFDYDDPSQDDIWPDPPLDIDVRTPVPGI